MRVVRWAVLASVVVVACGAAYRFALRSPTSSGLAPANAAEQAAPVRLLSAAPGAPWTGESRRAGAGRHATGVAVNADPCRGRRHGPSDRFGADQAAPRQPDREGPRRGGRPGQLKATCCSCWISAPQRATRSDRAQIRKAQAQVAQAKRDCSRSGDLMTKGAGDRRDARHLHQP